MAQFATLDWERKEKGEGRRKEEKGMASPSPAVLPVGFRFRPTDEELVRHYLKAKIAGRSHPDLLLIPVVNLNTCEPWDLPALSIIKSDDPEWFFFGAPRESMYRSNRSTAAGYWKATGKDRLIRSRPAGALIGIKKTLVFHRGRAPRGHRTAWIMHEYRTTEPHFQSLHNGSFVLYRLFNKQDQETPTPRSNPQDKEKEQEQCSHSHSLSPSKEHNDANAVQASITSIAKVETLPSDLSQLTATQTIANNNGDNSTARLTTIADKEQTTAQEDAFMDVLARLPDLQPEQRYYGLPTISPPMCSYTDHTFVGNMGEQDLSSYFDNIIAEQDLQDLLLHPAYAKTDKDPSGNDASNPTAVITLTNNSNNKALLEDSWRKIDSDQHADHTDATCCPSGINILQTDAGDANNERRAQNNLVCSEAGQGSHLCSQYQLRPSFDPQMESQNSGLLCSNNSSIPYPQYLFNAMSEPSSSSMIHSDTFDEQGGCPEAPSMQHFTISDLIDPQQGTAARRIRLVCSVERSSAPQSILTPLSGVEDEAGSCYSTDSLPSNHKEDYSDLDSQNMVGEMMHIQGRGDIPTQVGYPVEISDKLQDLPFNEDTLRHTSGNKLPRGANLKQRQKQESAETTHQSAHEDISQKGERVHGELSREARKQRVQLLWLALLMLVLVVIWKSLNY